jgi:hypothetical protein
MSCNISEGLIPGGDALQIQGMLQVQGILSLCPTGIITPPIPGFWIFNDPCPTQTTLTNFSVGLTNPAASTFIEWGDNQTITTLSDETTSHLYACITSPVWLIDISYATSPEVLTLTNLTGTPQDLTGWYIYSHDGTTPPTCPLVPAQLFTFPSGYILNPGQSVQIYSGPGGINNPPSQLIWTGAAIWNNTGDICTLYNNVGTLMSIYVYGQCTQP